MPDADLSARGSACDLTAIDCHGNIRIRSSKLADNHRQKSDTRQIERRR
ncbi:hypothetical protein [Xenorhabdus bovienii]|uniref:Uncharacterized protein n=1 Tax=Xenorhabdus bovienii str. kraussei Becker Underwood TaxID=1398204 RepID=A0A077PMS2_XENBV|nr:hypothetical protein [Xenorhabdus bovienii]CDH22378.1 hypothetical protein XBKB1_1120003 [Xenorhabdus bovienii str. kraussei Becker Underwood]